jgi:hypothetical protein
MEDRHEHALMAALEEVQYRGWTHVESWKVYLWYNIDKVRKLPYRDLSRRWAALNTGRKLHAVWTETGLLLVGRELQEVTELAE